MTCSYMLEMYYNKFSNSDCLNLFLSTPFISISVVTINEPITHCQHSQVTFLLQEKNTRDQIWVRFVINFYAPVHGMHKQINSHIICISGNTLIWLVKMTTVRCLKSFFCGNLTTFKNNFVQKKCMIWIKSMIIKCCFTI